MIAKPKTDEVLVRDTYIYSSKKEKKIWYPAKVKERLSVQFTAEYVKNDKPDYGYYFYKDRGYTWKEL